QGGPKLTARRHSLRLTHDSDRKHRQPSFNGMCHGKPLRVGIDGNLNFECQAEQHVWTPDRAHAVGLRGSVRERVSHRRRAQVS
ncbi:unnamed protein product, partial [Mycena citricolor]